MKPSLYLETTIPSYLVGRIARDLATAAHQEATKRWWDEQRDNYELYISSVVYNEIIRGDSDLARERQSLVEDLPRLDVTPEVAQLARELYDYLELPRVARADSFHLALACHCRMDYLLSWNLKHIASGRVRYGLSHFRDIKGITIPTVCTPEELLD